MAEIPKHEPTVSDSKDIKFPLEKFEKDAIIFREGSTAECLYFILDGKVEIYISGEDGKISLGIFTPNMIFGEMAVLDKGRRSATAKALETTICQKVTAQALDGELKKLPPLLCALFRILTLNLRSMNKKELSYNKQLNRHKRENAQREREEKRNRSLDSDDMI